jgi:hypothetical protein
LREILYGLADAVISDIVGRRFSAQDTAIADVLFEEAMSVVTAENRVGEIQILEDGLELAMITAGNSATEDDG